MEKKTLVILHDAGRGSLNVDIFFQLKKKRGKKGKECNILVPTQKCVRGGAKGPCDSTPAARPENMRLLMKPWRSCGAEFEERFRTCGT